MDTVVRDFDPLAHFQRLYATTEHRLAFQATTQADALAWQAELRAELTRLLGGFPTERVPLQVEVIEDHDTPGWRRQKIVYDTDTGVSVPAYVLYPHGPGPFPAVLALHGHGQGKVDLVGLDANGEERQGETNVHSDFALALVQRGCLVLVPEQACFGERRDARAMAVGPRQSSCRQVAFYAQMLGKTVLGMRVWDAMRGLDLLQTLPAVAPGHIGCMGLSGGGTTALFTSALDERIRAVVLSGYLNTFEKSILAVSHCECNYVPGILRYAEMYDVAALIAPRPLFVESGTEDPIFPAEATKFAVSQVTRSYAVWNASDHLAADYFPGGHQVSGRQSYDWLVRQLYSTR